MTKSEVADIVGGLIGHFTGEELEDSADSGSGWVLARWREAFTQAREDLRLDEWHANMCAETSTLVARRGDEIDPREAVLFEPDDSVVLLASDTVLGLVSALLVASRVTGGDLSAIHYGETPRQAGRAGAYTIVPGAATVVRVRGLDPRADDAFTRAAWGTGDVMRAAREVPGADLIDVHLSGGFKAVLLHTLALTEVLRSQDRGPVGVKACYVYEDGDDTPTQNLIEIGLRRVTEGAVRTMRDELISVRDGRRLDSAEFEGVAWDRTDGQPKLNAFGHGFLAVLGNPSETSDDASYVR